MRVVPRLRVAADIEAVVAVDVVEARQDGLFGELDLESKLSNAAPEHDDVGFGRGLGGRATTTAAGSVLLA